MSHLLDRIHEREIGPKELDRLSCWLDTQPEVPIGDWYKRFSGMIVCGRGALVHTFLTPKQTPIGEEL